MRCQDNLLRRLEDDRRISIALPRAPNLTILNTADGIYQCILGSNRIATQEASAVMRTAAASILLSLAPLMAQSPTVKIVAAANAFLSTLDAKQRQSVV